MDPSETLRRMLNATQTTERREYALHLLEWIDRGGFGLSFDRPLQPERVPNLSTLSADQITRLLRLACRGAIRH